MASTGSMLITLTAGMTFSFTGTLLPQISEYVNEDKKTWLGKYRINFKYSQVFTFFVTFLAVGPPIDREIFQKRRIRFRFVFAHVLIIFVQRN